VLKRSRKFSQSFSEQRLRKERVTDLIVFNCFSFEGLSQSASGHTLSTASQPSSTTQSSANAALAAQPVPAYTNPPQAYATPTSGNFWNPYWGSQPQAASAGYPALPGAPATAASTTAPPPSYLVSSQSASTTVPPPYNNVTAAATGNSYLVPVTSSSTNPVYSVPMYVPILSRF
jgi:hypothetical protein